MTRLRPEHPPRESDPARVVRDPREPRGQRTLEELTELAAIYEPSARAAQERINSGVKVYPFEKVRLADWQWITAEIARRQA